MDFKSGAELLEQCAVRGMTISEVMKQRECDLTGVSMEDMEARMKDVLAVMRDSATLPLREPVTSIGGLIGGESARMEERRRKGTSILSGVLGRAVIYAMAVLEVNTSMGLIVAAPTAGSSGIVPGLLLALQEEYGLEDDLVADGLFAASAVGYLAMRNATVSGAVGGCQAEVACRSGAYGRNSRPEPGRCVRCPDESFGTGMRPCGRPGGMPLPEPEWGRGCKRPGLRGDSAQRYTAADSV